jgi:hypothetical protein
MPSVAVKAFLRKNLQPEVQEVHDFITVPQQRFVKERARVAAVYSEQDANNRQGNPSVNES